MAKGRKISGIYVPITLDTSAIDRDLSTLRTELGRAGESMMKSMSGSVNSHKLVKGFVDATKAVGQLRDSVRAFDALKPMGSFSQSLQSITPELRAFSLTLGITRKQQEDLLQRMARNTAINQQVEALRTLQRTLGATAEETLRLARSYGLTVSQMAENRYLGRASSDIHKMADEYRRLSAAAGQMATAKGFTQFLQTNKIREAVAAFKQLNPNVELTSKYYKQIADAAGAATQQVEEFMKAQKGDGGGLGSLFSPEKLKAGVSSALSAAGVVTGVYGLVELGKAAVQAALDMENITKAFESIYGGSERAATQIKFVRELSERLGLSFKDTAEGAKMMFASFHGTELEDQANRIFESFSMAGAALKLSGDKMNSVFLAVSQMAAKGKVSAEELRSQLAEHLPGAVTLFAQSIGVTTRQLDKMLQDGAVGLDELAKFADAVREKYQSGAYNAATSLQAELNRVSNAWFDLKKELVDTDALAAAVRQLGNAMRFIVDNADGIGKVISTFGTFVGLTAGIYGVGKAITYVVTTIKTLGGISGAASAGMTGLMSVLKAHPWLIAASAIGGLVTALIEFTDQATPADAAIKKFTAGYHGIADAAGRAKKSIEEMGEAERNLEMERLRSKISQAEKDFADLFKAPSVELPTNVVSEEMEEAIDAVTQNAKSGIAKMFDEVRTTITGQELHKILDAAQSVSNTLGKSVTDGIAQGLDANKLADIVNKGQAELKRLEEAMRMEGADSEALDAFGKIEYAINNAMTPIIKFRKEFETTSETVSKEAQSIVNKANTAFDALLKLTEGTELGRERKVDAELKSMAEQLVIVGKSALEAQDDMDILGFAVAENQKEWDGLQGRVDQMNTLLPMVAQEAIRNGKDFDTMAASLTNAAIKAGYTYDEIMRLYDALRLAFNVEIGKSIEKDLDKLDAQIAQVGAKVGDKTAFGILKKYMGEAANEAEVFAAVQSKSADKVRAALKNEGVAIEDIEKIIQKSSIFGSKSETRRGGGGSRRGRSSSVAAKAKDASDQLSAMGKEILAVEKKIGALQAKVDDDPSVKFLADVNGELQKLNTLLSQTGKGTDKEKERLTALRDEYAALADQRAAQMRQEEENQKKMQAAQMLGQGWGKLSEVNTTAPARVQTQALRVQYEENLRDYEKLLDAKIIKEEEYTNAVLAMNRELNIKIAQANGGMLANFAATFSQTQEEINNWQQDISTMVVDGIGSMSDAFANFAITGMRNTEELGSAFKSLIDGMIQDLARLFMRMVIMSSMNAMFNSFFGGIPTSGYSGTSSNTSAFGPVIPNGVYAKGGAFAGGNISAYSGSVVAGPTLFSGQPLRAYANGGNLMGEKGPEAVMPLSKMSNGRLGVDVKGAASSFEMNQSVNIQVYNNTDSEVSAKQSRDEQGNLNVQLMVEKIIGDSMTRAGSSPFRALRGVWSANPKLAQRG